MALFQPLQALLKRLALIAAGLSSSSAMAIASQLQNVPEDSIGSVIEESEEPDWNDRDRVGVLRLLAFDARASVRHEVATSMMVRPGASRPDEAEALIGVLAADRSTDIRGVAAADLAALLAELSPLRRTDLVCRWATDDDPCKRVALASALRSPLEIVGGRTALEHLSGDPDPAIRAAARASHAARTSKKS